MSEQELLEFNKKLLETIGLLNKKVDKLTNIVTKMGKILHIMPVTEKEERELQLLQRKNLAQAAKISEEIAAMSPAPEQQTPEMLTIFDNFEHAELFGDVLGDDYLGGAE